MGLSNNPFPLPNTSYYGRMVLKGGENMQELQLSDEADLLLCVLYNAYVARRKDGMSRVVARNFGSSQLIQAEHIQQLSLHDIDDAAWELKDHGLFDFLWADSTVYSNAHLTTDAVAYMEHKFGDKLNRLLEHITQLLPLVLH